MATEKDYQALYDRIAALRETVSNRLRPTWFRTRSSATRSPSRSMTCCSRWWILTARHRHPPIKG